MMRGARGWGRLAAFGALVAGLLLAASTGAQTEEWPPSLAQCKPTVAQVEEARLLVLLSRSSRSTAADKSFYLRRAYQRDCHNHDILLELAHAQKANGESFAAMVSYEAYLERAVPMSSVTRAQIARAQRELTFPALAASNPPASSARSTRPSASSPAMSLSPAPLIAPAPAPASAPLSKPSASAAALFEDPWADLARPIPAGRPAAKPSPPALPPAASTSSKRT